MCMSLSRIQLLGRSIDLTSLLSQRLGSNMLKAIDTAIHVFESRNLCGVVVSTCMLKLVTMAVNAFCHDNINCHGNTCV